MNHKQRGVLGTVVIAFIVIALFYIPWRIESNGDIAWAPFYRNPVMGRSVRITEGIENRFIDLKGRPIWWLYGTQLVAIASAGAIIFRASRDKDDEVVES